MDQQTIRVVTATALRNVAVYVILDVDLRQFGRHCFKCIFFAFVNEAESMSGLYANVHSDLLTSDSS